jgi:DNA-binding response OmpR family regulator
MLQDVPAPRNGRGVAPTILVVDDDEYVHETLRAALRAMKVRIIKAGTAAEGLALAREARPELAIVDLGLPDADGYHLTRQLRADPDLAGLRILILTGHVPDEEAATAAGADAIVGKPFHLHKFLELVTEQLRETIPVR